MTEYRVAVVPGDGTGPEVLAEAEKVLDAAQQRFGFTIDKSFYDMGGARCTSEETPKIDLAETLTTPGVLGKIRALAGGRTPSRDAF